MLSFKNIITTYASIQTLHNGLKNIKFTTNFITNIFTLLNLLTELMVTFYITTKFTWAYIFIKLCENRNIENAINIFKKIKK